MKRALIALVGILALLLSGCAAGEQDAQAGEQLLTAVFTSNQDGRWDTLQSAVEGGEDLQAASDAYLAAFQPYCTADGLALLADNRYPTQCDSLAQEYGVTIQPGTAELSEPGDTGAVTFSLPLSIVSDGQETGSVTLEGQLILAEEDGALLVDSIAIYNLDDLSAALAGG